MLPGPQLSHPTGLIASGDYAHRLLTLGNNWRSAAPIAVPKYAPHPAGTGGHAWADLRSKACFACKDAALFSCEPGDALTFRHKATTGSVEVP